MLYLDHNATTPVLPEVLEAMLPWFAERFGNASAACEAARPAREAVAAARDRIAALFDCRAEELVFVSGGTEADNAALASAWNLQPAKRLLVLGATEHSAVHEAAAALVAGREGGQRVLLPVDSHGVVERTALAELLEARAAEVALVSVHWANNETGVIQPVGELGELCRRHGVSFHTDAVQAAGKVPLSLAGTVVDFASFSAHKLGGPQGIGALWVRSGLRFGASIIGGGQEEGRRSGTLNVPGIVGFGAAAEWSRQWLGGTAPAGLAALRDRFEAGARGLVEGLRVNGEGVSRLPNTSNLFFPGCEGEALRLALDTLGLCCSAGSACRSESLEPSRVLLGMGLDESAAKSSLRFSFGRLAGGGQVDKALHVLERALARLGLSPGAGPVVRRGQLRGESGMDHS